jgi:hypothetical protein
LSAQLREPLTKVGNERATKDIEAAAVYCQPQ